LGLIGHEFELNSALKSNNHLCFLPFGS